eukprot:1143005-Pelagomonas_calceolata.AAC.1
MDACCEEKLREQGIEVPENTSRDIPDWAFPNGSDPSARNQSRPDAVFACPIPGRATHLDPRMVPAHDRDIHLVELKYCPDTNPLPSLQAAADQHAGAISRLCTRSLRNPKRKEKKKKKSQRSLETACIKGRTEKK